MALRSGPSPRRRPCTQWRKQTCAANAHARCQSAVGGWRLAVGGWRSAVGGRRSAVGGRRSAVGGRWLAVGSRQSAVGSRRLMADATAILGRNRASRYAQSPAWGTASPPTPRTSPRPGRRERDNERARAPGRSRRQPLLAGRTR
ncbi:hypothetical protein D2V84_32990 [Burkholderia pseudomallei]|nr:hypothetical protein D2V84_32990 [Burkholderia pseudomallei]RIV64076.1 hypothetical protein D2W72_25560 [Burkholderia pseudomallei]